jgi:hypothetical protein
MSPPLPGTIPSNDASSLLADTWDMAEYGQSLSGVFSLHALNTHASSSALMLECDSSTPISAFATVPGLDQPVFVTKRRHGRNSPVLVNTPGLNEVSLYPLEISGLNLVSRERRHYDATQSRAGKYFIHSQVLLVLFSGIFRHFRSSLVYYSILKL